MLKNNPIVDSGLGLAGLNFPVQKTFLPGGHFVEPSGLPNSAFSLKGPSGFPNGSGSLLKEDLTNLTYQKTLTELADKWRQEHGLPGVWCAFIKDGRIVACVARGVKNLDTQAPATINDFLNIGSVSKVLTGTLVAHFVSQGVLNYQTTVGEVFPELSHKAPGSPLLNVTLRQLITHEAGLPLDVDYKRVLQDGGKSWRYAVLCTAAREDKRLKPAGPDTFNYSNLGPIIATAMVERKSGTVFEDWLGSPLGKALGLRDARMLDWTRQPTAQEVATYAIENGGLTPNLRFETAGKKYATGASFSLSLLDLCSFAQSVMYNKGGLNDEIFTQTLQPVDAVCKQSLAGWKCGNSWRDHTGNTGRGEYCYLSVNPTTKRALIFYTNAYYPHPPAKDAHNYIPPLLQDFTKLGWVR